MDVAAAPRMKVYCEHHALTSALRELQRAGRVTLIHFPYDPDSRSRKISRIAVPSAAQYDDLNLRYDELRGTYGDFGGSPMLPQILRIIGSQNRRDALHVDSAYKSGCCALVTRDSDILGHRKELESLLGNRLIHPDEDREALVQLIDGTEAV